MSILTLSNLPTIARKKYSYVGDDWVQSLTFELSEMQEIDSVKYSLYDLLADERVHNTTWENRVEMLNSWISDMKDRNHYMFKRSSANGCKPVVSVMDERHGFQELINFASNDYLNLSHHPRVIKKVQETVAEYGIGSGGAPLLNGTNVVSEKLEQKIAACKGCEAAMVLSSGYGANIGIISALMGPRDLVIYDMYAHASLIDGGKVANKKFFMHNDPASLEKVLRDNVHQYMNKLIVVDGVYSMDGDIAKLDAIVEIARHYGAWVLVDEAHATGVIGKTGKGTMEHWGMEGKVDIVTGTFSKAVGVIGGYIAGSRKLINYLNWAMRSYMFSTAPMLAACAAATEALEVINDEPQIRETLWKNINLMKGQLNQLGYDTGFSETAIIPIIIKNDTKIKEMAFRLHQAGIFVNPVPYPAVPRKLTRIKLTVMSGHTEEQINYAVQEIDKAAKELGVKA